MDQILEAFGLKYEELTGDEKSTLTTWLHDVEAKSLSIQDIQQYVSDMKNSVATQLADTPHFKKEENILLKARLKNYSLLEAFLSTPQRAKRALEQHIEAVKRKENA